MHPFLSYSDPRSMIADSKDDLGFSAQHSTARQTAIMVTLSWRALTAAKLASCGARRFGMRRESIPSIAPVNGGAVAANIFVRYHVFSDFINLKVALNYNSGIPTTGSAAGLWT